MTDGLPTEGRPDDGEAARPIAGAAATLAVRTGSPGLRSRRLRWASASPTIRADAWRTIRRRPDTIAAGVVLAFFTLVVLFPTLFTSQDPQHCLISESKLHPGWFGAEHPFGTDSFGCDVLAQLVYGARPSLLLAVIVVGTSVVIGVVAGLARATTWAWSTR